MSDNPTCPQFPARPPHGGEPFIIPPAPRWRPGLPVLSVNGHAPDGHGDLALTYIDGAEYAAGYGDPPGPALLFRQGDEVVAVVDATPLLRDGMVSSVEVSGGNLVVTFNTDAGKEPVEIPLTDIFDPDDFALIGDIAPDWTATAAVGTVFVAGQLCSFDGRIYRCVLGYTFNGDSPPSSDPTHWALATLEGVLAAKQDAIGDLAAIRSGAAAGATAYQKPAGGIAAGDLAAAVQTSLGKADTALQAQDITGKADKAANAASGHLAALDANGNLTDSGKKAADFQPAGSYKTTQTAVADPSVPSSGTTSSLSFIDTISQDANGVITPTKKNVATSAPGTTNAYKGKVTDAYEAGTALAGKAGLAANNTFTGNNEFNGSEEHNGAVNFLRIPTLKSDNTDRMAAAFPVYVGTSGSYYLVPHVTVQDGNTATTLVDSYDITSAYVRDLLSRGGSGSPGNWYVRIELNCTSGTSYADGNLEPVDYIPVRYYDAAAGDYVDGYVNPNIYIEASPGNAWTGGAISFMSGGGSYPDALYFQFDLLDAVYNVVGFYQAGFELTQDDYPTYSPPSADDSNGYHAVCNYSSSYFNDGSSSLDSTFEWLAFSTAGTGYVPTKNTRVASEFMVAAAEARINNTLTSSYPQYSYLTSNYVPKSLTASTSRAGIVQLSSSTSGGSATKAATENALRLTYNLASGKYSKPSGGIPASDLASGVIPTSLKNPNALTIGSGNSAATYDGSSAASLVPGQNVTMTKSGNTVTIAVGGGGKKLLHIVIKGYSDGYRGTGGVYSTITITTDDGSEIVYDGTANANFDVFSRLKINGNLVYYPVLSPINAGDTFGNNYQGWTCLCLCVQCNTARVQFDTYNDGKSSHGVRFNGAANADLGTNSRFDKTYTMNQEINFLTIGNQTCLAPDTVISTPDGGKQLADLRVGDKVLSMNTDGVLCEDEVSETDAGVWPPKFWHTLDTWTFSDGTELKTIHPHEFYSADDRKFKYIADFRIGERVVLSDGSTPALESHKKSTGQFRHMTLFTKNNTYFANGVLTGNRNSVKIEEVRIER